MFQSYLPEDLWDPDKQSEVETWLNANIEAASVRKVILIDWCTYYGISFTVLKAQSIGAEHLPPP